jgi:hypothetical protein
VKAWPWQAEIRRGAATARNAKDGDRNPVAILRHTLPKDPTRVKSAPLSRHPATRPIANCTSRLPAPSRRAQSRHLFCAASCLLALAAFAADDPLARFDHVVVDSAKTSIYVGSVTMSFAPATRKAGAFESTYTARVFPYFFMSEKGKLVLDAPDELLRKLARGEAVDFSGRGVSTSGDERRFEGHATPLDATSGKLKVHAFVSKRIDLIFHMTYRFTPTPP